MSAQPHHEFDLPSSQEAMLSHEFRFDLEGHKLVDPQTNRGTVGYIEQIDTTDAEGYLSLCNVFEVEVIDPFVDADPLGYKLVNEYINRIEARVRHDGFNVLTDHRQEATSRDERNRYTNAWVSSPAMEAVSLWRDLVPTAEALEYLTNPYEGRLIRNREGDVTLVTSEASAQMRFVDDAIAIRDRAVAMQDIAEAHLAELNTHQDGVRWLSLASGTAEPAIAAVKAAQARAEASGQSINISLTVADYDEESLEYVKANAQRYGFNGEVNPVLMNILTKNLKQALTNATSSTELYDVVENMGFEEYLPQEGDELKAKKGMGLPQASEFTRRAYDLVKPGGILISGNMVLDRPQIDYVFGIVDWPIINARSEESILRVYAEAGILDDPGSNVEMYRVRNAMTGGHIYNIVKVTKLA